MASETEVLFPMKKRLLVYGTAAFFLIAIILGIAGVRKILDDPGIPLLIAERGADWIRARRPMELRSRPSQILTTLFRTGFDAM